MVQVKNRHIHVGFGRVLVAGALCSVAAVSSAKPPKAEPPKQRVDELEYEVVALQSLRELDVTPEQLAVLAAAAVKSAGKAPGLPPATAEFKAALSAYADALAVGDDDKIGDAEEKVDDLRDSLQVDPPPEVPATDGARAEADRVVALLTPAQLAGYVAEHSDEVPDPVQTLLDAAESMRSADAGEQASVKAEAAKQFGMLVAGVDPAAAAPVAAAAEQWLGKAQKMSDPDFEAGRAELTKQAKAMVVTVDSFAVLRHWMDRELVDLLANPQLGPAVKRVKAQPKD